MGDLETGWKLAVTSTNMVAQLVDFLCAELQKYKVYQNTSLAFKFIHW